MARSRPFPERLTARVSRLLQSLERVKNALARERVAHADTQTLWTRQYEDLQKDRTLLLDTYRTKMDAHQKEIGEKNALMAHLRTEITSVQKTLIAATTLPAAHSQLAGRVVPLKYWADTELLALLHDLENSALLPEVHGLDGVGLPMTVPRPFPMILLTQVTQEVAERKLTVRPHTSIAVAE